MGLVCQDPSGDTWAREGPCDPLRQLWPGQPQLSKVQTPLSARGHHWKTAPSLLYKDPDSSAPGPRRRPWDPQSGTLWPLPYPLPDPHRALDPHTPTQRPPRLAFPSVRGLGAPSCGDATQTPAPTCLSRAWCSAPPRLSASSAPLRPPANAVAAKLSPGGKRSELGPPPAPQPARRGRPALTFGALSLPTHGSRGGRGGPGPRRAALGLGGPHPRYCPARGSGAGRGRAGAAWRRRQRQRRRQLGSP